MKAGITDLAALSFANTGLKLTLIGKFCSLLPFFFLLEKQRGTGKTGKGSRENGQAERAG